MNNPTSKSRLGIATYIAQYNTRRLYQAHQNRTTTSFYDTGNFWQTKNTSTDQGSRNHDFKKIC